MRSTIRNQNDDKFDRASTTVQKAVKQQELILYEIIMQTAKKLVRCGRMLPANGQLTNMLTAISQGTVQRELDPVARGIDQIVKSIDRSKIDFSSNMPEAHFVAASLSLQDAIREGCTGRYDDTLSAYASTVRARSSLAQLENDR